MKLRKWIPILFCGAIIAAGAGYGALRHFEKSRQLEQFLTRQLSLVTHGTVTVGHVRFGFFSVYLEDVNAALSLQSCTAVVHNIQVSFSLRKLLKTHGDFGKSISRIILLSPRVEFSFSDSLQKKPLNTAELLTAFRSLPLDFLLVKKGAVSIKTASGFALTIGEELNGKLWEDARGVSAELQGKFASRNRNLYLSAYLSASGRDHHASVRVDNAQVQKPILIPGARIVSGMVNSAFTFTFSDSVSAETLVSAGWLKIFHGVCAVDKSEQPVSGIGVSVSLKDKMFSVDSLCGTWNGILLRGEGTVDLSSVGSGSSDFIMRGMGIRPELLTFVPSVVTRNLSGMGWFELHVKREKNVVDRQVLLSAGGMQFSNQSITGLFGNGHWGNGHLTVDTLALKGPDFSATGSGMVDYEKLPVAYSLSYAGRFDSLIIVPALHGRVSVHGSLHGLGANFHHDAVVFGDSLSFYGISLGSPKIKVTIPQRGPLSFLSFPGNEASVSVRGAIDSVTSQLPFVNCHIALGKSAALGLLSKTGLSLVPVAHDSAWGSIAFSGSAAAFSMSGTMGLALGKGSDRPGIRGNGDLVIDKSKNNEQYNWRFTTNNLTVADSSFFVRGEGSFVRNMLVVDSIAVLPYVRIAGFVGLGQNGTVELTARYKNFPVGKLIAVTGAAPVSHGYLSGATRVTGATAHPRTDSELHCHGVSIGALPDFETDIVMSTRDAVVTILPFIIRQSGRQVSAVDSVTTKNGLHFSGTFQNVDIYSLVREILPEEFAKEKHELRGTVNGTFSSAVSGTNIADVNLHANSIALDGWRMDSVDAAFSLTQKGFLFHSLSASDSSRAKLRANGFVPFSSFTNDWPDTDTLRLSGSLSGDLIASFERNASKPFNLPVAGHGIGVVEVSLLGVAGDITFTKAQVQIPRATVRIKPYVAEPIKDFSLMLMGLGMQRDSAGNSEEENGRKKLTLDINATIAHRPIRIHNTHVIPQGFEPIRFGFLDLGALLVSTPKHGVDVHVPGLTDIGVFSDVECEGKAPWPEFAVSGPADKICLSGTWIIRSTDITFPPFDNVETRVPDLFPFIQWNVDVRVGNRNVKYIYDTGKDRRLMRLVECYIDPVSILSLHGRDLDKTFRITGSIRSSKGAIFYSRTFDRNVDIGLDFVPQPLGNGNRGYDNMPIIWGSAEAISDTSRFDWIKLTLLTRDSISGAFSERGRLYDMHFRVGSSIESVAGETQQRFANEEKDKYMSVTGAGSFVSNVGEQYIHRLLFQNLERRLAKSLGLDVVTIETSIASNYFNRLNNRQNDLNRWDYLALANVGVTMGRYIFYDKIFLKWRTELISVDTLLKPEYNVGFEIQPLQYLLMDVNYGIQVGDKIEQNPQVNLELRLPIKDIRHYLHF